MLESYESVYLQFYDLFHQQPQSENTPNNMVITTTDLNHENDAAPDAKKTKGRCSKKDRHSKIITASGPRDRRMRLSLDVARRFFQLQDILGYDKASRTVDWLLNSSRDAIKELLKRDGRSRSTSSSITESIYDQDQVVSSEKKKTTKTKTKTKKNNNNNKLVAGVRGAVGKESRQKARERARERTSQKKRLQMMTKNSTSTSAATFNEERIDDDHHVTATRGDENNTNTTLLFSTAGLAMGPWNNINTSTSVFGDNATWNF